VFGIQAKTNRPERHEARGPANKPTKEFLAEVTAEECLLARELEKVMSHPPVRRPSDDERNSTSLAPENEANSRLRAENSDFSWISENDALAPGVQAELASSADETEVRDQQRKMATANSAAWLKRARRERTRERLRHAVAYVLAVLIGGLTVAAAAYLASGQHLDVFGLIFSGVSRTF
jgi:hypothetical protein